ncbi:unnamed protein product [Rotaria sp. Silwood2]|nr:unnamed protein product [Rotaria sp. Silwood2]CAF2995608.1 unnamed protein product [Rotaria sp. Silwood2]CAF3190916.1 unnamed protein product [Rotaria sp. Silwood2]CAF3969869.1 unnamed protein product [Rotaria sp. Silwood2]CAF4153182.1 unnamed protein product [Rotaria sp. Silwood2]
MTEQQNEAFETLFDVDLSKFIRTIASERTSSNKYEEINDLEHLSIIWVDSDIDRTSDCLDTKKYLSTVLITHLKTYTDPDEFIKYISLLETENASEQIFLIISGSYGEYLIPKLDDRSSVIFIYIYCLNSLHHKQWTHSWSNIRGIFTDKSILIDRLTNDIRLYTSNIPAFSILNLTNEEKSMRDLTKEKCHIYVVSVIDIYSSSNA